MYRKFHKLRVRFAEMELRQKDVSRLSGVPVGTLSNRMTGRQPLRTNEIVALAKVLEIKPNEYGEFFFEDTPKQKGA